MKIEIKNLGIIQNAEIDLSKDLIVFTGYNNTGKTYLNYLLFGLYKIPYGRIQKQFFPLVEIEDLSNEFVCLQTNFSKLFEQKISTILNIYENLLKEYCQEIYASETIKPQIKLLLEDRDILEFDNFISIKQINENFVTGYTGIDLTDDKGISEISNGVIKITFDRVNLKHKQYIGFKDKVKDIIKFNVYLQLEWIFQKIASFNHIYQREYKEIVYFFPAERATLVQFTTDIVGNAFKNKRENNPYPFETDQNPKRRTLKYQLAIENYILYIHSILDIEKYKSDYSDLANELENMLGGKVFIDKFGSIKFKPYNAKDSLDMQISSSTVKCLAVFVLYLRHEARENDVLFIDEPELNLHPKNQIAFARILAKLINKGIKIIVSTHSDYITKELSSLVLLHTEIKNEEKYWLKYNLTEDHFIDKNRVGLYYFNDTGNVIPNEINGHGLEVYSFDKEIDEQNQMFDTIYFKVSCNE